METREEQNVQPSDDVVFLRGKRLYLRPPCAKDIPSFLRWMNDQEVTQYLSAFLPVMEADEAEWIERIRKNKEKEVVLVIVDIETGKPIGSMGIHGISWKDRRATTGAVIGEKSYWGKGYGTEAKMLLLNYAFNTLNLRKICSRVFGFNGRSRAYSEKCGYKIEGTLRDHHFKRGAYCDEIHLAVFREDWLPIWERFQKMGNV
jgi:RimJ/RimL family protein N-acetyltransferase